MKECETSYKSPTSRLNWPCEYVQKNQLFFSQIVFFLLWSIGHSYSQLRETHLFSCNGISIAASQSIVSQRMRIRSTCVRLVRTTLRAVHSFNSANQRSMNAHNPRTHTPESFKWNCIDPTMVRWDQQTSRQNRNIRIHRSHLYIWCIVRSMRSEKNQCCLFSTAIVDVVGLPPFRNRMKNM